MRQRVTDGKQQVNIREETQEDIASIVIEPHEINCPLALFRDQSFELMATAARRVELVWRRAQGDSDWQRVAMDQHAGDKFSATIGIDDGEYLFGYEIDGRIAPDARYAQRIRLLTDGAFSLLKLSRYTRTLALYNPTETERAVKVESDTNWVVPETDFVIPARQTAHVALRLLPSAMALGANHTMVRIISCADGDEAIQTISVRVHTEVAGAIPDFSFLPRDFGRVTQGVEEIDLTVEIQARGHGPLRGMVTIAHSGEVVDLQLNADEADAKFSHRFTIDSLNLPCRDDGRVKITLITDSYLANYRLFKAEVPYRLSYLKKSLQVLNFKQVREGMTGTIRLEVTRSDDQEIELEAAIPATILPYVELHHGRSGVYVFRFNAQGLIPGTLVDEEVILWDRRSELRTKLRLCAQVVNDRSGSFENSVRGRAQGSSI